MNRLKSATLATIRMAQELYAPSEMARMSLLNYLTATPSTSLMGCSVYLQPCQRCIDTLQGQDIAYCRHALKVTKEATTFVRV